MAAAGGLHHVAAADDRVAARLGEAEGEGRAAGLEPVQALGEPGGAVGHVPPEAQPPERGGGGVGKGTGRKRAGMGGRGAGGGWPSRIGGGKRPAAGGECRAR